MALMTLIVRLRTVVKAGSNCKPGAKGHVCTLVVAGSGGHTAEILRLMASLSPASYSPRHYVIADTDQTSEDKIRSFESLEHHRHADSESKYTLHRIPRSREVGQWRVSSGVTFLKALFRSLPLVFRLRPDVILCNGPGTCVPPCLAGVLLGVLGVKKVLIVYVESVCRVETLSLSGRILYPISDYFFVQWPTLKERYPKSIFRGRVV